MHKTLVVSLFSLVLFACREEVKEDGGKRTLEQLQQLVGRYPDSLPLRLSLFDTLRSLNRLPEALAQADSLLRFDSANAFTHGARGELLLALKDTQGAMQAYRQVLQTEPQSPYAEALLLLYAQTRNPATLRICDSLLQFSTKQKPLGAPHYYKGIYYSNTGQADKAMQSFNACIAADHSFMEAYIEKGAMYYDEKKYAEALKIFELAANVSNTFADAYYWQGKCYEALKDKEAATLNYQRAIGLDKTHAEAAEGVRRVGGW